MLCELVTSKCAYSYSGVIFTHVGGGGEMSCLLLHFLDQSTIPICRHDNQHLAFAHLFQRGCQRDQVCISLVASFPQVQQNTRRTGLCCKVVQVPEGGEKKKQGSKIQFIYSCSIHDVYYSKSIP